MPKIHPYMQYSVPACKTRFLHVRHHRTAKINPLK